MSTVRMRMTGLRQVLALCVTLTWLQFTCAQTQEGRFRVCIVLAIKLSRLQCLSNYFLIPRFYEPLCFLFDFNHTNCTWANSLIYAQRMLPIILSIIPLLGPGSGTPLKIYIAYEMLL